MATDLTAAEAAPLPEPGETARRRPRRWFLLAVALAATVVGVVAARQAVQPGAAGDSIADEGAAPPFDLPRVASPAERVSLAQFAGRPVVVNFWASWCVPCRKEMPALQAVSERLRGRVSFVGVNHQDDAGAAAAFEQQVGVRYPSGADRDGTVAPRYGVFGLPTTVLVDAQGTIVGRRLGEVTEQELLQLINDAFGPEVGEGPS